MHAISPAEWKHLMPAIKSMPAARAPAATLLAEAQ